MTAVHGLESAWAQCSWPSFTAGSALQAWRLRALHFHLVQLVGLHGGGPCPHLALARARAIPELLQSRAFRLTQTDIDDASCTAGGTITESQDTASPKDIVLNPLVVMLSMPVFTMMQIVGVSPSGPISATPACAQLALLSVTDNAVPV